MEKEYYTVTEIAEIFGMSLQTVRRLIAKEKIPARRIGLKWYVPKSFADKGENNGKM